MIDAEELTAAVERDGAPADDRSSVVDDALECEQRVGYFDGKPLVGGDSVELALGDDPTPAYDHYPEPSDLLLPSATGFLQDLADATESVADAAAEVNADTSTVRKAFDIHGVEPPDGDSSTEEADDSIGYLILPSGEELPLSLLDDPVHGDKIVLASLLSMGMGVEEIALWLSRETGDRVTEGEIRDSARQCSLLGEPRDSPADGQRTDGQRVDIPPTRDM